jgi:G protein-coupled glucose receptor regulating Gpa2
MIQLFKQVRTYRHQLILGLAISDFWMAVNFLSSCAANLTGNLIGEPSQKAFCSFNGFMTQLFVVQSQCSNQVLIPRD